jgi:hypothetical protein
MSRNFFAWLQIDLKKMGCHLFIVLTMIMASSIWVHGVNLQDRKHGRSVTDKQTASRMT